MAEQDDSEKTEDPTQKRLDDARQKGQVATSREINHWFVILGGTIFVLMLLPPMMRDLAVSFRPFLEQPHAMPVGSGALNTVMRDVLLGAAAALIVPILLFLAAAFASGLVQHGFLISFESLKPKLEKISPLKGFQRLFSSKSLAEFVKGVLKLAIVGTVCVVLLLPELRTIDTTLGSDLGTLLGLMHSLAARLLIGVLSVMTLIAALDFLYQKHQHTKQLRMSRQDLKEEFKQSEGDPVVKQRLRQIRLERSRRRMMSAVPDADVVVTNPTHFAVALVYDPEKMSAPKVVAKGVDALARRIREVATENSVPLIENPPLARALHAGTEIDEEIPAEHYKAVAEIISYVWKLKDG